jgi:hypothetical protein
MTPMPTDASVPRSSFTRAGWMTVLGLLAAGAISVLLEGDPAVDEGVSDLELAIPIPTSARLVQRRIDRDTGRSIAVLDLDPTTPPAWNDVRVVTRRGRQPGVFVSYATKPVEVPPPSASIDDWRAFAAGSEVRLEPHPDLRSARSAMTFPPE